MVYAISNYKRDTEMEGKPPLTDHETKLCVWLSQILCYGLGKQAYALSYAK